MQQRVRVHRLVHIPRKLPHRSEHPVRLPNLHARLLHHILRILRRPHKLTRIGAQRRVKLVVKRLPRPLLPRVQPLQIILSHRHVAIITPQIYKNFHTLFFRITFTPQKYLSFPLPSIPHYSDFHPPSSSKEALTSFIYIKSNFSSSVTATISSCSSLGS